MHRTYPKRKRRSSLRGPPLLFLDFDYHREDHGTAFGALKEELTDHVADLVTDEGIVCLVRFVILSCDDLTNFVFEFAYQIFSAFHVDKSSRNDVWRAGEFAGSPVDLQDDHHHAVFGHNLAVAEHHFADVSHAQAVYKDLAFGEFFIAAHSALTG